MIENSSKEKIHCDGNIFLPQIQAFCFTETKEFRLWCSVIYSIRDTSLFKHASSPAGRCVVKCSCLQGFINIGLVSALQDAPGYLKNNWTLRPDMPMVPELDCCFLTPSISTSLPHHFSHQNWHLTYGFCNKLLPSPWSGILLKVRHFLKLDGG